MARIRTIKPEFWEDEAIGVLTRDARLLYIATWNQADDEGLLRWSAAFIKANVFMYDDDITAVISQRLMTELVEAGMVFPYIGGKARQTLAYVVHFLRHQRINRPQPSKLPAPSLQNPEVRQMYARRDSWTCHLCNGEINWPPKEHRDHNLAIDHLTCRIAGGSDYPSNVKAAHETCNQSRGSRPMNDSVNDSVNDSQPEEAQPVVNDSLLEGKGKEGERKGKGRGSTTAVAFRADVEVLCAYLADKIQANGSHRPTITSRWRDSCRLMLDKDARTEDQIRGAIDWSQADEFWRANILSMPTLREKYDQLRLAASRGRHNGAQAETDDLFDRAAARMAAREATS